VTSGSSPVALKDRLDAALRDLTAQKKKLKKANTLRILFILILLAALGGEAYFIGTNWGDVKYMSSLTKPDVQIQVLDDYARGQLPDMRKAIEVEVKSNAPAWAASLSEEAKKNTPLIREKIEKLVMEQIEQQIAESEVLTKQHFTKFVKANRSKLQAQVKELADHDHLPKAMFAELEQALDEELQVDMKETAKNTVKNIASFNAYLERLKANKGLNDEEMAARRVAMLTKGLQKQGDLPGLPPKPDLIGEKLPDPSVDPAPPMKKKAPSGKEKAPPVEGKKPPVKTPPVKEKAPPVEEKKPK